MSTEVRLTFPYSPVEHAAAQSESVGGRRLRLLFRVCGFAIGGLPLIAVPLGVMVGEPLVDILANVLPLVALGAFWAWGASPLLNFISSSQLRRQAHREAHVHDTRIFSDAGFTPSTEWVEPMPWSFVERVVETKRFLLVYHGYAKEPSYIPTHALSVGDREQLGALLKKHLESRPTSLPQLRAT